MSYFNDVYLKRINRYGNTLQDRIQGKREHDFIAMMNKSPNKVEVREVNPWAGDTIFYNGVLQTKEYDEDEIQNYLLVPCNQKVPMGYLLYFTDVRRDVEREKPFMAFAEDPYTTAGYNRYTVVELEETLKWIVDGVPYSSPVHATGGGSGARDKNINLKFRIQFSEAGVYLPNKRYSLIMPYNEAIKKNHRVTLGGETWRITGFDKISVSGVMYLTNIGDYGNWSFIFDTGISFVLAPNQNTTRLLAYYNQIEKTDVKLILKSKEKKFTISPEVYLPGQQLIFTKNQNGTDFLQITIQGREEWVWEMPITITPVPQPIGFKQSILGPQTIHMGDIVQYNYVSSTLDRPSFSVNNDCLEIKGIDTEHQIVTVEGKNIGTSLLNMNDGATLQIEVISLWLGGKDNVDS